MMARRAWLDQLISPAENIHRLMKQNRQLLPRMRTSGEFFFQTQVGISALDLILLKMGDDGRCVFVSPH